jgi:hypothetical protein
MSTRKRAGLDARASAISAAAAVREEEEAPQLDTPEEEGINITLRLPVSMHETLGDLSRELRKKRLREPGRKPKKQGASDPLSVNGLIRQAVREFLERSEAGR